MKQNIIIFLLALSLLLTGCAATQNGTTTEGETQGKEEFITYEDSKKITDTLSAAFDGFDCNVFVNNTDTGVDFSLSMKCNISTAIYADFVVWFSANVLEVSEDYDIPISKVDVTFFDTTSNNLITWESSDGITGRLCDFTSNPSVEESVSPDELIEIYGSAELDFPLNG